MKSIFHTVAAAALLGCLTFTANATDSGKQVAAQFHVAGSNKPNEFTPVTHISAGKKGGIFGNFEPVSNSEFQWQVLNIPVRVGAGKVSAPGGDKVIPTYVPEITFHVYVRVEANMVDKSGKSVNDKRKSCVTLDKEITYVNIPLKKATGNVTVGTASVDAMCDMNVAVFLSPSDVCRLTEDPTNPYTSMGGKTQPKIKVVAVAMEATYKGVSCWRTPKNEKTDYLAVDPSICSGLSGRWWKNANGETKGAVLHCISETPFASDYYPYYCPTKPLYGDAPSSGNASSAADSSSDSSSESDSTPAADDSTATDSSETDDPADSGRGGKRKTKDKKKR